MKKYRVVVCGGTFDHLHQGHKDFLQFVFSVSEKAVIGLTSDKYIGAYKSGRGIEPYEIRKQNLDLYLGNINKRGQTEIIPIDDHLGPAISSNYPFDALVATTATLKGAEDVNEKRLEIGLKPLPVEVFQLTVDEKGIAYSSSRIREDLLLPENLRQTLREPLGEIVQNVPEGLDPSKIITVGDVTTKVFLEKNLVPRLAIIDLKIERDQIVKNIQELGFSGNENIMHVKNPAGSITEELENEILKLVQGDNKVCSIIIVEGEEDLAVLPVLIFAPLGNFIFYGQPGQGMVQVEVNKDVKIKAQDLLEKFDKASAV